MFNKINFDKMNSQMNMKHLLVVISFVISTGALIAQTRYFDERYVYTQAPLNPQLINPGAYGASGKHQILVNYRNKWQGIDGSPSTITLSYNGDVGNRLGIGVTVLNDRFGALETTKGGFGLSYTIKTEKNQVGFGMSAEYIRHGINGVGNADPNDPVINRALSGAEYFDASFGIHGIYLEKLTYGLMIPSAVSARISDIDEEAESRPVGFILMAGYEIDLHTDITMTPMFLMKNLAYVPTHIDLNLNFGFLQDKLIAGINYTLGADKRLGFLIGTNIEKFNLLYSYNTSSSLIQDYNNGSHEVTLGVNF